MSETTRALARGRSPPTCWARWSPARRLSWSATCRGLRECRAELRWLRRRCRCCRRAWSGSSRRRELRERVMAEVRADAGAADAAARAAATGPVAAASAWLRSSAPARWACGRWPARRGGAGRRRRRRLRDRRRDRLRRRRTDEHVVAGKAPGVTAKMVSEGDAGTLQLANVHQLPQRPGARGLGAARRRGRSGARPCSSPTATAGPAPSRRHERRRSVMVTAEPRRRQRGADLGA